MSDCLPPAKKRRKRGEISAEDHALWQQVARSIKPLPGRLVPEPDPADEAAALSAEPAPRGPLPPLPDPPKSRGLPGLAGLEKRLRRDVARGIKAIDARIDLHGMRQGEAHGALLGFIRRAHQDDAALVLVITGKGGSLDPRGEERGILRRLVPHWLADPALRHMIIGFEPSARGHGGDGALYVRLRRRRTRPFQDF